MGEKSRVRFIVLITLILAAAVVYSFSVSLFQDTPSVGFADIGRPQDGGPDVPDPFESMVLVDVTPDTVQRVIETLDRYASYSRTVTVEYLNMGLLTGTLTAAVAVDGAWTRADVTEQNGRTEHSILGEGVRWLWYDEEEEYVEVPADGESADLLQRLPTYEDTLEAEREHITAASYELRGGVPCVYVEVLQPELDYLERFWVSVESGLLVSSETVKDGQTVYRMSSYQVESPLSGETDRFSLPDGTVLHQAEG